MNVLHVVINFLALVAGLAGLTLALLMWGGI